MHTRSCSFNNFVLLLGICFLFSCKKYLDVKSNSALVVPTNLENFQAILDNSNRMNQAVTPSFCESSADDFFIFDSEYDMLDTRFQNVHIWKPTDYNYQNDWGMCYNAIYNANLCLDGLLKIEMASIDTTLYRNVKGSALFYRAFYFLQLVWEYAKAYDESSSNSDLGIVLRLSSDYNIPSVRTSVKTSYQQIIKDANEAVVYLPDIPSHPMRPSKCGAYGLLARTYLSMRSYDSAWKYSNLCLQLKNELMDYKGDPDIIGNISDIVPFTAFNKEVIFHSTMNFAYYAHTPDVYAKVDTLLYSMYESGDLRKTAFYSNDGEYFRFKGNYNSSQTPLFSGIATDEMYLIRAECYAKRNNPDKDAALNDLNTLLEKRYDDSFTPVIATDANQVSARIILERRKELLMRGLRWMDIKRLNKENANITLTRIVNNQIYSLQPNANYYALPLPTDIINISGIPQNPQ